MADLLTAQDLTPHDSLANLRFTLGKADEDAGRYAEAFGHYARRQCHRARPPRALRP